MYPDPIYRPLPKPAEIPIPEVPRSLFNFDPEINKDFEEKFTISRGCDLRYTPKVR